MFIVKGKRAPPRLPHVGDGIDLNQVIFISLYFPSNRPTPLRREQTLWGAGVRWTPLPQAEAPTEAGAETQPYYRQAGSPSAHNGIESNCPQRQGSAALPEECAAHYKMGYGARPRPTSNIQHPTSNIKKTIPAGIVFYFKYGKNLYSSVLSISAETNTPSSSYRSSNTRPFSCRSEASADSR